MKKVLFYFLAVLVIASFLFSDDKINSVEEGTIEIYFCPHENCEEQLAAFLDSAQQSIHCALFDVGLESIQHKLTEKAENIDVKVKLIIITWKNFRNIRKN